MRHLRRRHGTEQPHQHEETSGPTGMAISNPEIWCIYERSNHRQRAADRGDEHAEKFEHRQHVSEPPVDESEGQDDEDKLHGAPANRRTHDAKTRHEQEPQRDRRDRTANAGKEREVAAFQPDREGRVHPNSRSDAFATDGSQPRDLRR